MAYGPGQYFASSNTDPVQWLTDDVDGYKWATTQRTATASSSLISTLGSAFGNAMGSSITVTGQQALNGSVIFGGSMTGKGVDYESLGTFDPIDSETDPVKRAVMKAIKALS